MTEKNSAQPGLTDAEIEAFINEITISEACIGIPSGHVERVVTAALSKLRAERVLAGGKVAMTKLPRVQDAEGTIHYEADGLSGNVTLCGISDFIRQGPSKETKKAVTCDACKSVVTWVQSGTALASAAVAKKRAPLDDWRVQAIAECLEAEWEEMFPDLAEANARIIVGYLIEFEKESDRIEAQHAAEPAHPVVQAVRNLRAGAPVDEGVEPMGYVLKGKTWPNQIYYPASHKPADIQNWTRVYDRAAPQADAPIPEAQSDLAPLNCPITGRPFFMALEHPELGMVPTYGGPFESYTIPHLGGNADQPWHERELLVHHYDHDLGGWRTDCIEVIPLRIVHEDVLLGLQDTAPQERTEGLSEAAASADRDAVMSAVIQAGQSAGIIGGDVKRVSGAECMCILDYLSRAPVAGEAVANMFWDADFPNEVHESLKDAMYAAQSNHGLLQDDLADIQCAIRLPALRVLVTEGDEDGDVFEYKVIEGQEACQPRAASAPGTDDQPTKEQAVPTVSEAAYNTGFGDGLEVAAVVVNNLRSDGLSTDLPSIVVALRALKGQHAAHASAPIVMLARDDGHGVIRAFDAA